MVRNQCSHVKLAIYHNRAGLEFQRQLGFWTLYGRWIERDGLSNSPLLPILVPPSTENTGRQPYGDCLVPNASTTAHAPIPYKLSLASPSRPHLEAGFRDKICVR